MPRGGPLQTDTKAPGALARVAPPLCLALFLAALLWLRQRGLIYLGFPTPDEEAPRVFIGLVAVAVLVAALPRVRHAILGGASVLAFAYVLPTEDWLLLFGYAFAVCAIVRTRVRLRYQLVVAGALWLALPLSRATVMSLEQAQALTPVAVLFTALAYPTLLLLVERGRWPRETPLLTDLFYLLALPRLVITFFQPISPRTIFESETPRLPLRVTGRALLLGAYGLALGVLATRILPTWSWPAQFGAVGVVGKGILRVYCLAGAHIFIGVTVFRLLGFPIPSGFRLPFLSQSFAEFFRRWNHYVRDAVLDVFLFPLQGWLRRYLSHRMTRIVAAYGAIFLGAYLMNEVLVPVATYTNPTAALASVTGPRKLFMHLLFWSAIVLPARGLGMGKPRAKGLAGALRVLRFNALYFGVCLLGYWLGTAMPR